MTSGKKTFVQLDLLNQLRIINDVKFTHRELDIISFFICGRSAKKIASFFSISPKTVENHVHNIMIKLGCNSREYIIDFIEKSNKLTPLRKYYSSLLVRAAFEKTLKEIAKQTSEASYSCCLIYCQNLEISLELRDHLEHSLTLAGVKTSIIPEELTNLDDLLDQGKPTIYLGYKDQKPCPLKENSHSNPDQSVSVLLFLPNTQTPIEILHEDKRKEYEQWENHNTLYVVVFEILQYILSSDSIKDFRQDFFRQQTTIETTSDYNKPSSLTEKQTQENIASSQEWLFLQNGSLWMALLIIGMMGILFLTIHRKEENVFRVYSSEHQQKKEDRARIRSDLILPSEVLLLDRPDLLAQIDKKFKGLSGIQTVALVGLGGAGKTTLARRYAASQTTSCIWEINAESQKAITDSFEELAQALSTTEEDLKILTGILKIRESTQRKTKLISFVRERLKSYPLWILLYDNVEKFADIQDFFPKDAAKWGEGKVIITSRDSNIANNNYVTNVVTVGELSAEDKFKLFSKIMNNEGCDSAFPMPVSEVRKFLIEIPPFPLDILIASYYIKATNTSYQEYVAKSRAYDHEFSKIQEKILREAGEYAQTRYNIITLSLNHLVTLHQDHRDLLLLTSLLNPGAIQKELLLNFKEEHIVDKFIVHMKRYSLITHIKTGFANTKPSFSMHRSTQRVIRSYLIHKLNINKNDASVKKIADVLERSMNRSVLTEDFALMKILSNHAEHFLKSPFIGTSAAGKISGELGCIYYYLCQYSQAKSLLHFAIRQLKQNLTPNARKIAYFLVYLGNIHRRLGESETAMELFEQSIKLYKKIPEDHLGMARACGYLGIVYESLGLFNKASTLLEESLRLYEAYSPKGIGHAWSLAHIGSVYKNSGSYEKARESYEKSLKIYRQFSPSYVGAAWVCRDLGAIYAALGNYTRAAALLKESMAIYKKHFSEDHIYVAYALVNFGILYRETKKLEKAKTLIKKSLTVIQQTYGPDHVETGRILKELAKTHFAEGNLRETEEIIDHVYTIFKRAKHPEQYEALEILAEIYQKKATLAFKKEGKTNRSKQLQQQAHLYLIKAEEAAKIYFPKDSPHYIRIQTKLKEAETSRGP